MISSTHPVFHCPSTSPRSWTRCGSSALVDHKVLISLGFQQTMHWQQARALTPEFVAQKDFTPV